MKFTNVVHQNGFAASKTLELETGHTVLIPFASGSGGWPTHSVAFSILFEPFHLDAQRIRMIPLVQLNDIVCFVFWL
jgi:hypothetical protein